MGIETAPQTQINPGLLSAANLVAPASPVVTPSAVAALADAFRGGQVSADDIISRYGDLAKTKEKAEIQGLHEFISPEAIQARKDMISAQGGAAKLAGLRSTAEMGLVGPETDAKRAEINAAKLHADMFPDRYDYKQSFALKVGAPVPPIPPEGMTDEWKKQMDNIFQRAVTYDHNQQMSELFLSKSEPQDEATTIKDSTGKSRTTVKHDANFKTPFGVVDRETHSNVAAFRATPFSQWEHNPQSFSDVLRGTPAGQIVQPKGHTPFTPGTIVTGATEPEKPTVSPVTPELGPDEYLKEETDQPTVQQAADLRKELGALPEMQEVGKAEPQFEQLMASEKLLNTRTDDQWRSDPGAAGPLDMRIAFNYFKLLHPDTRVTEANFKEIPHFSPVDVNGKQIADWLNLFLKQGTLDPTARRAIIRESKVAMQGYVNSAKKVINSYGDYAESIHVPRASVVLPHLQKLVDMPPLDTGPVPGQTTPGTPAAPGGKVTDIGGGKKLVLGADGQYHYVQ